MSRAFRWHCWKTSSEAPARLDDANQSNLISCPATETATTPAHGADEVAIAGAAESAASARDICIDVLINSIVDGGPASEGSTRALIKLRPRYDSTCNF